MLGHANALGSRPHTSSARISLSVHPWKLAASPNTQFAFVPSTGHNEPQAECLRITKAPLVTGRPEGISDLLPEPAFVCDHQSLRILSCNAPAIQRYGFPGPELLSRTILDLFEEEDRASFRQALVRPQPEYPVAWKHRREDGRILDVELSWKVFEADGRSLLLLLSHDITRRVRSERRAAVFASLGQRLSSVRTPRQAAESIIDAAEELFGWDACLFELCAPSGGAPAWVLGMDTVGGRRVEVQVARSALGPIASSAIEHGPQLLLRSDVRDFPAGAHPFGDTSRPSASIMAVPVRRDTRVLAVLSIQSYTPHAYRTTDLKVLQALADHCVGALERLRAEAEISRLNSELRGHLEELQTLVNVAPVGIVVAHDPECRQVTLNVAAEKMLGVSSNVEAPHQGFAGFRALRGGRELEPEELPMPCAAREGRGVEGEELDIIQRDGSTLTCYVCASPLFDDAGKVRGSLGVFVDLTERKHAEREILRLNAELERRVRERTMQLEAINKELEAFSYSVSHDLRAPLRSIRGFSEVLLERYQEVLDERGREFLSRACESCVQMDRLIEDLLKLSRVGRSELSHQAVDLSELAGSILADLQAAEPDRKVQVKVTPGLQVVGDERLLRLALENLLRNAWKFTGGKPLAVIEFGRTEQPEPAFFVRDNGAGFDMAYASKLFGVFQRLHTASEFPGTGIGLATVQRVISRHGGRTWAEGVVDQGSTFYFTLPTDGQN